MPKRRFVWDTVNDCVLQEMNATGATLTTYTHEPVVYGSLVSQQRSGQTSYFHFDALGSTRLLTNDLQLATDTYTYDAWGNEISSMGSTVNSYRWVGQSGYQYDISTLCIYVRARIFVPTTARWLSADPLFVFAAEGVYTYTDERPTYTTDPSGLMPTLQELRTQWNGLLTAAENPHKTYVYYQVSEMGQAFTKLRNATQIILNFLSDPFGSAQYIPTTNFMLATQPVQSHTVVHESVHVLDDMNSWYSPAYTTQEKTKAEALAYTTQYLIDATTGFIDFENKITQTRYMNSGLTPEGQHFPPGLGIEESFPEKLSCSAARELWRAAWSHVTAIKSDPVTVNGTNVRNIIDADINDVRAKIGLDFRCSKGLSPIAQIGAGWSWEYESLLKAAGVQTPDNCACQLRCPDNLPESLK